MEPTDSSSGPHVLSHWLHIRLLRVRLALLGAYAMLTAGWYVVFLSDWDPLGLSPQPHESPIAFALATLILFGVQAALLAGAPQRSWPRPGGRRSIATSLLAGSAIAALLSAGLVGAGGSLYRLICEPQAFRINVRNVQFMTSTPTTAPASARSTGAKFDWRTDVPWGVVGALLAAWFFWFLIFALVGKGEWPQRFGRMYRMLLGGTVLELLITIPIDAQVRRRTQCYCDEGTFFALSIGMTAILWTFGPGVAILFLIRRQQRLLGSGCCFQCGYDLRGIASPRCPECGSLILPRRFGSADDLQAQSNPA